MNSTNTKLYNLLHSGNDGDVEFYCKTCLGLSSVLELGCGSGRVTIPLAKQGLQITGIDFDKKMLDEFVKIPGYEALSNKITLLQHDMRNFELNKKFDRIIIPFNTIFCLLSLEDVLSMLKTVKKHLNPNGQLIFDFYYMNKEMVEKTEHKGNWEIDTLQDENHNNIKVTEQGIETDDKQRFDTKYILSWEDGPKKGSTFEIDVPQRCILIEEIEAILKEAGLNTLSIKSSFLETTLANNNDQVIIRATL